MSDPSDYNVCDEHEAAYLKGGYCLECRITELEAQIKSVKACQQYDTEYNCEVEKVDDGWLLMLSDVLEALEQENDDA